MFLTCRALYFEKAGDASTAIRAMNDHIIEGNRIIMTKLVPDVFTMTFMIMNRMEIVKNTVHLSRINCRLYE